MRRNCLDSMLLFFVPVMMILSCKEPISHKTGHREEAFSEEVRKVAQPVNETIVASAPVISADSMSRSVDLELKGRITYDERKKTAVSSRVAGRIEKLAIKYSFQPVRKGQLIMEIYSPDLVAAQRELLFLRKENLKDEVLRSAFQKLRFLGMSQTQINQVIASGTPIQKVAVYSPLSGFVVESDAPSLAIREGQYLAAGERIFTIYSNSSVVAEFSVDANQASMVFKGQKVTLSSLDKPDYSTIGTVGLIEPVVRDGENFSLMRIYLPSERFLIGEMLQAKISVSVKKSLWLPQSAIVDLGNRSMVFVKEENTFVPKRIETGLRADGFVQVLTNVGNLPIARDAAYLVDSESFVNPIDVNNVK